MPIDMDDARPSYLQIADTFRRAIADGEYEVDARLPPVRVIAREQGVALDTAMKAMEVLKRDGVVAARPRVGTVVRDVEAARASLSIQAQVEELRQRVEQLERQVGGGSD